MELPMARELWVGANFERADFNKSKLRPYWLEGAERGGGHSSRSPE